MGQLAFTQRPLPQHTDLWLLLDVLITVECTDLWLLPLSELPHPEDGEPIGEPLGILGALCHQHHLPCPVVHQVQVSSVLLTSPSDTPSSRPCIQSSTLGWAEDWVALPNPQGCPGPLSFIFISMAVSTIAWLPFCTIFAVTSTCVFLLAQLTGPVKLNPMTLTLV